MSGSMTLNMEPFLGLSTSSVWVKPIQHNLVQDQSPLGSLFHSDEDILEVRMEPDYPWDAMHHHFIFLPRHTFSIEKTKNKISM